MPFGRTLSNHDPIFFKVSMSANLSGRVISAQGRGIRNATVTAVGADGSVFTTRTGPYGAYSFTQLPMGPGYSINVVSRRFVISPRAVNLGGNVSNFNFTAQGTAQLDEERSIR